jgi:hypothetical protein
MGRSGDLDPTRFPELSWEEPDLDASLKAVYSWVEAEGLRAADWYLREKRWKSRWSRWLRISAIVLATLGAALPFVAVQQDSGDTEWGYVLLALAAGAVALDRFFGFSTGWMRFMTAELAIRQQVQQLQFTWTRILMDQAGRRFTREQAAAHLEMLAGVAAGFDDEVRRETMVWIEEFSSSLADELRPGGAPTSARAPASRTTTVTATVGRAASESQPGASEP